MTSLKTIIAPIVLLLALAGCHEKYNGDLFQYTVTCTEQSEPHVFTETLEKSISVSFYTSGYVRVMVKERHTNRILDDYEWPDQLSCSLHKKFLGKAEPIGNDS